MNTSALLQAALFFNPWFGFASATCSTDGFTNPVIGASAGGGSTCVSGNVAISVNTTGTKLLYEAPDGAAAVTQSIVELLQSDPSSIAGILAGGPSVIAGRHDIFVKLCMPKDAAALAKVKTVQLLTHGATLDHSYWDIAPGFSYVDAASAAGYATLSYDQLGVGLSDHPDPIQAVQATSQVAVTHALVQLLRDAQLGGHSFDRVVGVGHSAGSTLTQAITTQYPQDFDAVILSGTSASAASVPMTLAAFNFVNANSDPAPQFRGLPAGYLTQQSAAGIQFAFYRHPNFDDDAFQQQVARKSTNTLGVLLTLGGLVAPSTDFTGPVLLVNGENDLVFCGGNCLVPTDQNALTLKTFYTAAPTRCQTYIAEGAGHAIAAHKSGPDSFDRMISFLQANKL